MIERPLVELALVDLLDAFASNDPVPGGGSASALAGALGVSLLIMVADMTRTRTGAPEETADLADAASRLRPRRDELTDLIDSDSDAYKAVVAAYKLPKANDAEKQARRDAIQSALTEATEVPLETMRVCQQALRGAVVVATAGNRNARSDIGAAVELLAAALRGAGMNVDINLGSLSDASYVARVANERAVLAADGEADAGRARAALV
ncbi:MAG TPA: cyclodeaminase/cyclohydrolase family protein [Vicinamibacterales bacterium]